ncbi:NosR/NirI family protein [Roseinatronobacter alkalisoli]|uniref:4Fe-4S binding protein n=1 Tax=Roseinatronobacter alkalisoli TaxID=3028235 RepID=A0ABT5TB13_9RHOB|nr:NosR/NirI family protein [Roseinatronobacter sp. HJB301]MDD7972310.1 4Fe-4S binding protein [Roseinatronobacter sp. HJB301]
MICRITPFISVLLALSVLLSAIPAAAQTTHLPRFLTDIAPQSLVEGATGFGPMRDDIPAAPLLHGGVRIGWVFITSDFVGTTGYSGKPIHTLVAIDDDARIIGLKMVAHSEPIVLIGIPEARIHDLMQGHIGLDLAAAARAGGDIQELNIISGVTVTIMVIDDSIVRSGIRVARSLGLGGLAPREGPAGPRFVLNPDAQAADDWFTLVGDGTVRRMSLDIGQVNAAFVAMQDPRASRRPLTEPDDARFIDMYTTVASVPTIGRKLIGDREFANLESWLEDGDHALLIGGRGIYSFKGSGYVRGGVFDRIVLIQGEQSIRFRDRDNRRLRVLDVAGAPTFDELDLFRVPAEYGFDPTAPWRLQLLVSRDVAALERVFTTFDLGFQMPRPYLREIAAPVVAQAGLHDPGSELAAQQALIERIWRDRRGEIAGLVLMLGILTAAFFFQMYLTRSARATYWFRMGFLSFTLVFLGWYAAAQLSVVNILALVASLREGFSWQAFMLDPLTFILWWAVAAALIFWGRGAYCGWLCPFGALQELTNQIARALKVRQFTLPWGLHERLWPVKYIIFLTLFAATLASAPFASQLNEIEPFKTAIVLKFDRAWPFVTFALVLLGIGLFIERFYCRYLCPLGAALAIPARIRMFDWLKRYKECGNPCQTCANDCFVQAIHPTGEINPNECLNCMNCQVLYQSETRCPVVIRTLKRREAAKTGIPPKATDPARVNHPNLKKEISHV